MLDSKTKTRDNLTFEVFSAIVESKFRGLRIPPSIGERNNLNYENVYKGGVVLFLRLKKLSMYGVCKG